MPWSSPSRLNAARAALLSLLVVLAWHDLRPEEGGPGARGTHGEPVPSDLPPAVAFLREVAIGNPKGRSFRAVRKWSGSVPVALTGEIAPGDRDAVAEVLEALDARCPEVSYHLVETPRESGIEIRLLPPERFAEAQEGAGPHSEEETYLWWDGVGSLHRGLVLVSARAEPSRRRRLLRQGLLRAMGLLNVPPPTAQSILAVAPGEELTPLDLRAVELFCRPEVRPGMTERALVWALLGSEAPASRKAER